MIMKIIQLKKLQDHNLWYKILYNNFRYKCKKVNKNVSILNILTILMSNKLLTITNQLYELKHYKVNFCKPFILDVKNDQT